MFSLNAKYIEAESGRPFWKFARPAAPRASNEKNQPIAVRVGMRLQKHVVDNPEYGRVGADADRKS